MKRLALLLTMAALVFSCEKNSCPVIERIIATPDSVYPGDTVMLSYQAYDEDNQVLKADWSCTSGSLFLSTSVDPLKSTYNWMAPSQPGDYHITLTISDSRSSTTDSTKVVVMDTCGSFTDSRDGHSYKWIKIGEQFWMAENLAFLPEVNSMSDVSYSASRYYVYDYPGNDITEAKSTWQYQKYGVLYNHPAALNGSVPDETKIITGQKGICPDGWHLPSQHEFNNELIKTLGGYYIAGGKMKEAGTENWAEPNSGATNESGFKALPGGKLFDANRFILSGEYGYFWSSTGDSYYAESLLIKYDDASTGLGVFFRRESHSIRCVKDK